MTNKELVKDIIDFLKTPNLLGIEFSKSKKIGLVLKLWIITLFTIVLLGQVINNLVDVPIPDLFDIKLKELGVPLFVLLVTVIGPFLEELTFRLGLRYKPSYLLISFVFIALYILASMSKISESLVVSLAILFTVIFLILVYFVSQKGEKSQMFYVTYYPYIFYGVAIVFGYVHIANFEDITARILWLSPLIVLPQILLGLGMGYVRVRLGFWYGVLFHILHNSVITFFLYSQGYFNI
ncbi:CPBP family glutamic-type intramembrane protease [Myroides sp. M-43]|uniref:CPBP family glutamic-type intramembrane protease n=1 Tax=Myroides oncorhynchi TaxID=2893756 RepID=UPI001E57EAA8|nr:CPBP family glutamic-type intramembrane protease [Myroides oncorhynchi]MCC9043054.1 CPBP family glutamic-type intramembrane protease [Myroides oncorhynchi]